LRHPARPLPASPVLDLIPTLDKIRGRQNGVTVRTSIHSYVWVSDWTTETGLAAAERAMQFGFDHMVVPLRDHATVQPERLARGFSRLGIVPLVTSTLRPENDISSTDAGIWQRGVAYHLQSLRIAQDMGAPHVGGVLYSALHRYDRPPTPENFKAAAEGLSVVAERAKEMGLTLAIEVVNRYESNLINTVEQAVQLIDDVGADNLFIHLDTFHMSIEEDNLAAALRRARPYLFYFELDQNHRGLLSAGTIQFEPLIEILREMEYDGVIGIEAFSAAVSGPRPRVSVAAWRELFSSGDEVAADARNILQRTIG
jgi:D-psicose/D-tagatose/L-ribulose 3-epimerase